MRGGESCAPGCGLFARGASQRGRSRKKEGVIADDHTFSGVSNQTTETLCMHSLSVLD